MIFNIIGIIGAFIFGLGLPRLLAYSKDNFMLIGDCVLYSLSLAMMYIGAVL